MVFIHGIQGHPRETWTKDLTIGPSGQSQSRHKPILFPKWLRKADPNRKEDWFWPQDGLSEDIKNVRIATYGYDSQVSKWFSGPSNQSNIFQLGESLLNDISVFRQDNPTRPIIFVAHSMGGLVLKDTLRRSRGAEGYRKDDRRLYDSTFAIIFMGTPHRGSEYASMGLMARNIAVAAGFDTNAKNLRDLSTTSATLQRLAEDFIPVLDDGKIAFYTFQEGKGYKGTSALGLNGRIVDDAFSALYHGKETKDRINANHIEMCRFSGNDDPGYRKLRDVLLRCVREISSSQITANE